MEQILQNLIPILGDKWVARFPKSMYITLFFIYFGLTILVFLLFHFNFLVFALLCFTVTGILLWSYSFSTLVKKIRETRYPFFDSEAVNIHCNFYELLVKNHSLVFSTVFCLLGISYFVAFDLVSTSQVIFNVTNQIPILQIIFYFYVFLLTFDVSFRVITTLNGVLATFYRNFLYQQHLKKEVKNTKSILPYIELSTKFDKGIYALFIYLIFWFPIAFILEDLLLILLFIIGLFFGYFVFLMNQAYVRRLKIKAKKEF